MKFTYFITNSDLYNLPSSRK